jgi:hypothetical protein
MLTAMIRGVLIGDRVESVMLAAFVCLWAFAAIGYVIGLIAQEAIETSVHDRITRELGERETTDSSTSNTASTGTRPSAPAA